MANNLFISYDLLKQGQDYTSLINAIQALGSYIKLEYSFWFVSSFYTADEARKKLQIYIDNNDRLIVVDAKSNSGSWIGLDNSTSDSLKRLWS